MISPFKKREWKISVCTADCIWVLGIRKFELSWVCSTEPVCFYQFPLSRQIALAAFRVLHVLLVSSLFPPLSVCSKA